MDISRATKQQGKYLPLFTDTEVNNFYSQHQIVSFFLRNEANLAHKIQKNAGRSNIANVIPSLSSQSEHTKNTIHWFGIYILMLSVPITTRALFVTSLNKENNKHTKQNFYRLSEKWIT